MDRLGIHPRGKATGTDRFIACGGMAGQGADPEGNTREEAGLGDRESRAWFWLFAVWGQVSMSSW